MRPKIGGLTRYVLARVGRLSVWMAYIGYACLVAVIVMLFAEVIMRYVFDKPTVWAYEAAVFAQALLIATGSAYVLREEGHISIELITDRLSERQRNWLLSITSAICVPLYAFMAFQMWKVASFSRKVGELSPTTGFPVFPFKLLFTIGIAMFAMEFALRSYRYYRRAKSKGSSDSEYGY